MNHSYQSLIAIRALLPILSDEHKEVLRKELEVEHETTRPELHFNDERLIVRWDSGHVKFSKQAVRRYKLVKYLFKSETGYRSAAELEEKVWDLKERLIFIKWNTIRMLGTNTEKNLEQENCPYMIEVEGEGLKILQRHTKPACELSILRVV